LNKIPEKKQEQKQYTHLDFEKSQPFIFQLYAMQKKGLTRYVRVLLYFVGKCNLIFFVQAYIEWGSGGQISRD
jgi:hypothetical protein